MKCKKQKINEIIKQSGQCAIERIGFDKLSIYCTPISVSDEILVLMEKYDFINIGYTIVRVDDITNVCRDKGILFSEYVFKKENITFEKPEMEFSTLEEAISYFKDKQEIVIIENEVTEDFHIGIVKDVNPKADTVLIKEFDGAGKWNKTLHRVKISNITSLSFRTNYTNMFTKYLPDKD